MSVGEFWNPQESKPENGHIHAAVKPPAKENDQNKRYGTNLQKRKTFKNIFSSIFAEK